MDIWQLLELAPTPDTKAIKRAYARKLKVTRPDEQPEAFQQLHFAYKAALEESLYLSAPALSITAPLSQTDAQTYMEIQADPVTDETVTLPVTVALTSLEDTTKYSPAVDPYQMEGERLITIVSAMLANHVELHNTQSWAFLLHSPYILDNPFNWRLGLEILQYFYSHNQLHNNNIERQIKAPVMTYLDGIFNWSQNRHAIYYTIGSTDYADLLNLINDAPLLSTQQKIDSVRGSSRIILQKARPKKLSSYYEATHWQRLGAGVIDGVILAVIFFLISLGTGKNHEPIAPSSAIQISLVFAFLYFVFFEASQLHATPGKMLLGLVVMNGNYDDISFVRTLCRAIMLTAITLGVAAYKWLFFSSNNHLLDSVFSVVIILFIAHMFTTILWLIDRAGQSRIINLRKSHREANQQD